LADHPAIKIAYALNHALLSHNYTLVAVMAHVLCIISCDVVNICPMDLYERSMRDCPEYIVAAAQRLVIVGRVRLEAVPHPIPHPRVINNPWTIIKNSPNEERTLHRSQQGEVRTQTPNDDTSRALIASKLGRTVSLSIGISGSRS
jgi:hypothetical protein